MKLGAISHGMSPAIAAAYRHCRRIATSHYENFTLGSWLLPRHLRQHIAAIYAFARTADDLADEGDVPEAERLMRLDAWEQQLDACYRGHAKGPIFIALGATVRQLDLPSAPFHDLLQAFRTDVTFRPFTTFAELQTYCSGSANPVGRLVLALFGYRDAQRQQLSDEICTGLQLVNFWQDLAVDAAKGRLYIPLEDLERFGCTRAEITLGLCTTVFRRLMAFQVDRARNLLTSGLRLTRLVDGRLAREVSLFAQAGLAILQRIEAVDYDVFAQRPRLSKRTKLRLIIRALGVRGAGRTPTALTLALSLGGERELVRATGSASASGAALRDAYAYCQEVTRRSSSNFYYAFRLLPPERREALHAVYAFCRFVDDIADDGGRRDPTGLLIRWRHELHRAYDGTPTHPISVALADTVRRFPLERRCFLDLIRGVEMDLTHRRYQTFDELFEYCYLVASTVGLLCIEIFGHTQDSAREYAKDLGVAFQLTNILRDVMEDGHRGRIYLPLEDLRRFDCTEEELLSSRYSPRFGALMAFECGRARAYYLRARGALAPDDRNSLAAAEAMRLIYEHLLDRIEARHFDVFGPRVTLPRYQKLTLALTAWGRSQLAVRTS